MKEKNSTTQLLLTMVIVYLAFAFIIWDLNPSKWLEAARGTYVFFVIFVFGAYKYITS